MSDIQYKQTATTSIKVEENVFSEIDYARDWPSGSTELFNAKYKAWEIRRGLVEPETQGKYFKNSNNKFFEKRRLSGAKGFK